METRILFSTLALLFVADELFALDLVPTAEPDVFTITGGTFGVGPTVVLHTDFEEGSAGATLGTPWTLQSSGGPKPTYTQEKRVTGTLSAKAHFTGSNYNSTAEFKSLPDLREIYVNYYVFVDHMSGDKSRNVKLARITSGYSSGGYDQPSLGITLFDTNSNGIIYMYPGESKDYYDEWMGTLTNSGWRRVEYYVKLSEPASNNNGVIKVKIDGKIEMDFTGVTTDHFGNSFQWLSMPYYVAHDPGGDYSMYFDNVVVSNNSARIEICSNDTYTECSQPIVAKTEQWSSNSVSFSVIGEEMYNNYAYVFSADGKLLNSQGVSICANCPQPPSVIIEK